MAAAATLLLGCSISFAAYSLALGRVDADRWKTAETQASQLKSTADRLKSESDQARSEFQATNEIGQHLVGNVEGRIRWLELLKAINECMPSDPPRKADAHLPPDAERITESNELHVTSLECQRLEDVSKWYALVKQDDEKTPDTAGKTAGGGPGAGRRTAPDAGAGGPQQPTGPGWIIQIRGHHFHNASDIHTVRGAEYVRKTLVREAAYRQGEVGRRRQGAAEEVTMQELGISFPVLVKPQKPVPVDLPLPTAQTGSGSHPVTPGTKPGPGAAVDGARAAPARGDNASDTVRVQQFDFDVQFCWQPKTPTERHEAKKPKEQSGGAVAQQ